MATANMSTVSMRGYKFREFTVTGNLKSGITASDIGKAVAFDATADNTFKLAGDGDAIIGRLSVVEDRTQEGTLVGAIDLKFIDVLPIKSGLTGDDAVARGKTVVGAGSGEVKGLAAASTDPSVNLVMAVDGTNAIVMKI